ncbi:MAG TPA: PAS domain S-box protein [Gemmatimonadales bacterium]|nr:PAS domain S-box protein [Gemmatimonadales bacterium]
MRAYVVSFAALVLAVVLRFVLDPVLGDQLPLVTFFGAVAAAVWAGGSPPAIFITAVGYLIANAFFMAPRGTFELASRERLVGLAAYLFTSSIIIVVGEAMRRAQTRANQRGEILRVTLQSIGDAVITTDTAGRIVSMNSVAEGLTGWTTQEAIGQPLDQVFRIINEETRIRATNPATRALREGVVVGLANHTLLVRKDGTECPIDDSAAPIRNEQGKVAGCVLIFRDVTAQRTLQLDLAKQLQAARLLAAIVEGSDDAIISKSLQGIIQSWNRGAERLFGYRDDEAIGRHISLVIPPERIAEEDEILANLRAGRRIDHFETVRVRSDGGRVFVSLTISPLKDDSGTVIGASKIVRDITERKRLEVEREQLADNLRQLAADLSEANHRKDEFLAMLAHELRNPLAPISNAVHILHQGDGDRATVHAVSAVLHRQVRQLARLVDDLLDMSRITRGNIELRKEAVALAPIAHQAIEASKTWCDELEHQLTVSIPDQPLMLDADPARLAQVIVNLLNNACKFTDRGGRIHLEVERDGQEAVIRVRDNGIGISPEQRVRIFEMFTQVDTSLERSRDGLGIGLTLSKTLVEQHGGSVSVRSDGLGHGSEFEVRLPLSDQEAPVAAMTGEPPALRRHRILIVDDNVDSARSLALLLELSRQEVHVAHDGAEGLVAAERLTPDLVLLDIGLPGLNGYEVCRRIRREPWGKDLAIVALTGWSQEEDRSRSREAGFSAHLVKPVDLTALMRMLTALP